MDMDKSVQFYKEALGLEEVRQVEAEDGSFILVFMGDGVTVSSGTYISEGQERALRPI